MAEENDNWLCLDNVICQMSCSNMSLLIRQATVSSLEFPRGKQSGTEVNIAKLTNGRALLL